MRILSLTQPWATLVALGEKRIETRSWGTDFRGPLAIHAAKSLAPIGGMAGLDALCSAEPFYRTLRASGLERLSDLPRGVIVAVAELVDCRPTNIDRHGLKFYQRPSGIWMQVSEPEASFGDYARGRYAWLLADVRRLREPLPYRGAQGLRTLPDDVAAEVLRRTA